MIKVNSLVCFWGIHIGHYFSTTVVVYFASVSDIQQLHLLKIQIYYTSEIAFVTKLLPDALDYFYSIQCSLLFLIINISIDCRDIVTIFIISLVARDDFCFVLNHSLSVTHRKLGRMLSRNNLTSIYDFVNDEEVSWIY